MMFTSKNKVCSHFYPTIEYKNSQNFQTSQILLISLYFSQIFNLKRNFSQSFIGGLKQNISSDIQNHNQPLENLKSDSENFWEVLIPRNNSDLPTGQAKIGSKRHF